MLRRETDRVALLESQRSLCAPSSHPAGVTAFAGDHSSPGAHLPCVGCPPLPPALMAARSGSRVCSSFPRLDGLRLGLPGSPAPLLERSSQRHVAYVGGARPSVSCVEAAEAIAAQLNIPRNAFSVHRFHPEDFLIDFATPEFRNSATGAGSVVHQGFELFFWPWIRQAQATARVMRVLVDIMIEGIPSHAWEWETAYKILGSSCDIISLAPETASREDLSLFKLRAWCRDPNLVPVEKRMDPESRRDFTPPENWRRPRSSYGSGQSGLPDDSDDSFVGGELQVLPWSRGVRDSRGPARVAGDATGAGAGRSYAQALVGRVGPSSWRLPPMNPFLGVGPARRATLAETPVVRLPASSPPVPVLETVVRSPHVLAPRLVGCRSPSRELVVATSLVQEQGMGPVMGSGVAPIIVEAEARAVESATAPAVDQVDQAALGQVPPMVREEDPVDQESLLTESQTIAKDPEAALPVQVTGEVEEVAPSAGSDHSWI
ncbi:hypothetical protein ZWY2020_050857 [Hordeum vulgare]|nr:hypothetical protein ZWY2020_050857 [Hordeum vulgare]